MDCPSCRATTADDSRYCAQCGSRLGEHRSLVLCPGCDGSVEARHAFCPSCGTTMRGAVACAACGERNSPRHRHCGACGARLTKGEGMVGGRMTRMSLGGRAVAAGPEIEIRDEKKVVTVLFSDISGFTAMSEKMDPEELKELMDAALSRLSEEIVAFGGHIDKYIGDAIMAIFGTPVAREDDAERAVRAALAMQQTLGNFAAERGVGLKMRVGMNTGAALLGAMGQKRGDLTAMGDTVNLAQRMESNAPVGGVLITDNTARALRDRFELEKQPPLKVKGKAEPIIAYVVKGERMEAAAPATALVGRRAELERLDLALAEARSTKTPTLIGLSADAGIGKTRLVDEWLRQATGSEAAPTVWRGKAVSFDFAPPFLPFAQMLRGWAKIAESDGPAIVRTKLIAALAAHFPDDAEIRADLLGYLLGALTPGSAIHQQMESDPKGVRRRAFTLAVDLISAIGKDTLILVFDDLQWARGPLLELLQQIHDQATGAVALIVLARPELYAEGSFAADRPRQHLIRVEPLSPDEGAELARSLLDAEGVPNDVPTQLASRCAGNPYYLEELVRLLRDRGVIAESEGRKVFQPERFRPNEMPEGVTALLQARLDSLSDPARALASRAAVLGRTFWDRALAKLVPGVELDPLLDELFAAEVAGHRSGAEFVGCREFEFKSPMLQEAAYQRCLKKERQAAHGTAAAWLEEVAAARRETYVEPIAHHWLEADRPEKAFPYVVDAADRCRNLYLADRALAHLAKALELAESTRAGVSPSVRREILAKRSAVHRVTANFEPALVDIDLAILEAGRAGDSRQKSGFRTDRADILQRSGRFSDASDAAQQVLADSPGSSPPAVEARCWNVVGAIEFQRGRLDESSAAYLRAQGLFETVGDTYRVAAVGQNLAMIASRRGNFSEAIDGAEKSLGVFRALKEPLSTASALNTLGYCAIQLGDTARALERFAEAAKLYRAIGDRASYALIENNLGWLNARSGDLESARRSYEAALAAGEAVGASYASLEALVNLGRLAQLEGKIEEAVRLFREADDRSRATGSNAVRVEALCGRLEADRSLAPGAVEELLGQAEDLLADVDRPDLEIGFGVSAARALDRLGRRQQALALATRVFEKTKPRSTGEERRELAGWIENHQSIE